MRTPVIRNSRCACESIIALYLCASDLKLRDNSASRRGLSLPPSWCHVDSAASPSSFSSTSSGFASPGCLRCRYTESTYQDLLYSAEDSPHLRMLSAHLLLAHRLRPPVVRTSAIHTSIEPNRIEIELDTQRHIPAKRRNERSQSVRDVLGTKLQCQSEWICVSSTAHA